MDFNELPREKALGITLENLSRVISQNVRTKLASVPGGDFDYYTPYFVGALIGLAYGTHRLYPELELDWVHIPERQNPAGAAFVHSMLRNVAVAPIVEAASKMFPPTIGRQENYEQFICTACLMVADHLLDPLRFELILKD